MDIIIHRYLLGQLTLAGVPAVQAHLLASAWLWGDLAEQSMLAMPRYMGRALYGAGYDWAWGQCELGWLYRGLSC